MSDLYDVIIVGGGPAGLGAAVYAARDKKKTMILEKFFPGGQINNTDRIENYPGIMKIDGPGLVNEMKKQAETFGCEINTGHEVTELNKLDDGNIEVICDDDKFTARAVILSPGSDYKKLGVPGEEEFRQAGAGVSYCGTCDAPFFKGKHVVSVGGGNTAIEETIHLAQYVDKVTLVHRRDEFRATQVLQDELFEKMEKDDNNIEIKYDTVVTAIEGKDKVQSVKLKNVKTEEEEDYSCDGVFIFIGMVPNTDFLEGFIELNDQGFIKADCAYLRTAVPGVFVAGDCRVGAAMQLATAVSDGVIAALMTTQYFRDPDWWTRPLEDILMPEGW